MNLLAQTKEVEWVEGGPFFHQIMTDYGYSVGSWQVSGVCLKDRVPTVANPFPTVTIISLTHCLWHHAGQDRITLPLSLLNRRLSTITTVIVTTTARPLKLYRPVGIKLFTVGIS
jgi:hypothetical protein